MEEVNTFPEILSSRKEHCDALSSRVATMKSNNMTFVNNGIEFIISIPDTSDIKETLGAFVDHYRQQQSVISSLSDDVRRLSSENKELRDWTNRCFEDMAKTQQVIRSDLDSTKSHVSTLSHMLHEDQVETIPELCGRIGNHNPTIVTSHTSESFNFFSTEEEASVPGLISDPIVAVSESDYIEPQLSVTINEIVAEKAHSVGGNPPNLLIATPVADYDSPQSSSPAQETVTENFVEFVRTDLPNLSESENQKSDVPLTMKDASNITGSEVRIAKVAGGEVNAVEERVSYAKTCTTSWIMKNCNEDDRADTGNFAKQHNVKDMQKKLNRGKSFSILKRMLNLEETANALLTLREDVDFDQVRSVLYGVVQTVQDGFFHDEVQKLLSTKNPVEGSKDSKDDITENISQAVLPNEMPVDLHLSDVPEEESAEIVSSRQRVKDLIITMGERCLVFRERVNDLSLTGLSASGKVAEFKNISNISKSMGLFTSDVGFLLRACVESTFARSNAASFLESISFLEDGVVALRCSAFDLRQSPFLDSALSEDISNIISKCNEITSQITELRTQAMSTRDALIVLGDDVSSMWEMAQMLIDKSHEKLATLFTGNYSNLDGRVSELYDSILGLDARVEGVSNSVKLLEAPVKSNAASPDKSFDHLDSVWQNKISSLVKGLVEDFFEIEHRKTAVASSDMALVSIGRKDDSTDENGAEELATGKCLEGGEDEKINHNTGTNHLSDIAETLVTEPPTENVEPECDDEPEYHKDDECGDDGKQQNMEDFMDGNDEAPNAIAESLLDKLRREASSSGLPGNFGDEQKGHDLYERRVSLPGVEQERKLASPAGSASFVNDRKPTFFPRDGSAGNAMLTISAPPAVDSNLFVLLKKSLEATSAEIKNIRQTNAAELEKTRKSLEESLMALISNVVRKKNDENEAAAATKAMCLNCGHRGISVRSSAGAITEAPRMLPSLSRDVSPGDDIYRGGFRMRSPNKTDVQQNQSPDGYSPSHDLFGGQKFVRLPPMSATLQTLAGSYSPSIDSLETLASSSLKISSSAGEGQRTPKVVAGGTASANVVRPLFRRGFPNRPSNRPSMIYATDFGSIDSLRGNQISKGYARDHLS